MNGPATLRPAPGPWRQAWQRLCRHRLALVCGIVLLVLAATAALLPWLSPYDYATPDWDRLFREPSWGSSHLFGTDNLGRDVLVRVMWGCRISLLVGLVATLVSVGIGTVWGTAAGYLGGRIDSVMMRIVDVLYSLPFIPLVIVLSVIFGRSFLLVFVAIGAVSWLDLARIVRGQAYALRRREFIEASMAMGVSAPAMIVRHLLPNLMGIVIVQATLTIPSVILYEALLSFLGLGVRAPLTSLGSLVADGMISLQSHPYLLLAPAIPLAMIIFCCNALGDGLRDALEPSAERS
jgi:oligopeptide transport system permease protein